MNILRSLILASLLTITACSALKVDTPLFSFTPAEIKAARKDFIRNHEAQALFIVMIDRRGKVVRQKLIEWRGVTDEGQKEAYIRFMRAVEFQKASRTDPEYREFLHPITVTSKII